MPRQAVRFNYFVPELSFEGEQKTQQWDMEDFLNYMINHKRKFNASVILGDELADFEWDDAEYDNEHHLYRFSLSKLRSKNIPSRKRVNVAKKDIVLDNDEYLGEFILLVFDPALNSLVVQSNFYGLTVKQTSLALSGMRRTWLERIDEPEENMGIVSLNPVPDRDAVNRALNNNIYRSVTIKGSNTLMLNDGNYNSDTMNTASRITDTIEGNQFKLTLSMGHGNRNDSLNEEEVRDLIHDIEYLNNQDQDVSMHISTKQDEEHAIEIIDLITPRFTTSLTLEIIDRQTIAADYLYQEFLEMNYYNEEIHARHTLQECLPQVQ